MPAMARERTQGDRTPAGKLAEAGLLTVLGYQVTQAMLTTDRIYEAAVGRTGLHRVEYTILMLVRANPGCTAASLSKALAVSAPNMVLWLERVAGKGLLERTPSDVDRRANHLHLTARGEETARQATEALHAAEAAALASLSPGERALLGELLHKVAACRGVVEAETR
jgi:DNA-binding MarR family transcriptional regulator